MNREKTVVIQQKERGTTSAHLTDVVCVSIFKDMLTTCLMLLQLPRSNKQCPSCDGTEAVFFQSQQRTAETGMVRCPILNRCHDSVLTWAEIVLRLLQLR